MADAGSKRRSPREGAATKQALIDAALELFAAHGIDEVSIRQVNAAADRALAAVHYHFGSKAGLVDAVVQWGGSQVQRRLADLIAGRAVAVGLDARSAAALLGEAFLGLVGEEPVRGPSWLNVVEQLSEAGSAQVLSQGSESEAIIVGLREHYPGIDRNLVQSALLQASQIMLVVLARMPWRNAKPDATAVRRSWDLIAFIGGGLEHQLRQAQQADLIGQ